jgi:subtilisin family serine protease
LVVVDDGWMMDGWVFTLYHCTHYRTGIDMNVGPVWDEGWIGTGIQVAVVDSGVHIEHPEMSNYNAASSWDFNFNKADAASYNWISHGTTLASLAVGPINGHCTIGIAHDAQLASLRLTALPSTDEQEARALVFDTVNNDIYVNAWGPMDDGKRLEGPGPLALQALRNGVMYGRGGLGSIYVWAAGNGGQQNDNVNYDGYANSRFTIAVGSHGFYGGLAPYSEPGAALLLTTPASGEGRRLLVGATGSNNCDQMFSGSSGSAYVSPRAYHSPVAQVLVQ